MTFLLLCILLAFTVSGICSLMEATLLSLSPRQVAALTLRQPQLGGIWQHFKERIERPISVILLLNTASYTIGAALAGAQFARLYGNEWVFLFSLGFTLLMLQFTEILPKTLGVRFNGELAVFIARPLHAAVAILSPVLRVLHWINKPFERWHGQTPGIATPDEIAALAQLAQLARQINPQQERIIGGASRLTRVKARDIMVPAAQVSFLSTDQGLIDALVAAHADAHTRYPVCEAGNRDKVAGYVNFKEIAFAIRTNPNDPSLTGIMRPIHHVPPGEPVSGLLRRFVDEHIHIAVVSDEHGHTLGLLTMEDIMEQMVGRIEDEFDRLPRMVHKLSGGTIMAGGGALLGELAESAGFSPEDPGLPVHQWAADQLGKSPERGNTFTFGGYECTARRVRRGKVFELALVEKRKPDA